MSVRFDYGVVAPGNYAAMDALDRYLAGCGLERKLLLLVQFRASQIKPSTAS